MADDDDDDLPRPVPPAPLVAVVGWLLPGAGHWLIGQRARGVAIGVSIVALFVLGLLVGGVRVVEVPGYNVDTGERQMVDVPESRDPATGRVVASVRAWALQATPLNEIRAKPWSVPQLMAGPIAAAAGVASVLAAAPVDPQHPKDASGNRVAVGAVTHARMNEIPSLYLSVAGLLNLMAVVDAAHRSVHLNERAAHWLRRRGALA